MQQFSTGSLGVDAHPLGRAALHMTPASFVGLARWGEIGVGLAALAWGARGAGLAALPLSQAAPSIALAVLALWLGLILSRPEKAAPLGGYDQSQGLWVWGGTAMLASAAVFATTLTGALLIAVAAMAVALWRLAVLLAARALVRRGRIALNVVIAGGGPEARMTLERLLPLAGQGVRILGLFDDRDGARSPALQMGVPRLGRMAALPRFAPLHAVDMIIVTMPPRAEERIAQILTPLWVLPVDIRLAPCDTTLVLRPRSYRWLGELALLDLFDRPLRARDAAFKRGFDLILGSLLTVLALPIMAAIAVAIRIDTPGPVLFRQKREGYVGAPFTALKFRSLHHALRDERALAPVTQQDARVTQVGRFLRRSSLDELPQLFNILRGDMSLVGPRPHAVGARSHDIDFAHVAAGYAARHKVKPGLTGLAQVRGLRGAVTQPDDIRRRLAADLDYIDTWSLWLDLRIVLMTLPAILAGKNAF
jgi:Undecaprenyl-phosphate glucose phosphotransferase